MRAALRLRSVASSPVFVGRQAVSEGDRWDRSRYPEFEGGGYSEGKRPVPPGV